MKINRIETLKRVEEAGFSVTDNYKDNAFYSMISDDRYPDTSLNQYLDLDYDYRMSLIQRNLLVEI